MIPMESSNNNSLIGKWEGFYVYDKEWLQEMIGHEKTIFSATITKEEKNGNFYGNVEDDLETGGTPGIGELEGSRNGDTVNFFKKMPIRALIWGPEKMKLYPRKKHPKIYYTGIISEDLKTISGSWEIKFGFAFFWFIPMPLLPVSGKFEMKKLE